MVIRSQPRRRSGVAAVELAVVLPILMLFFYIAVDYSRIFHQAVTVANCARNGALYLSDPMQTRESPYATLEEAALADAQDLSPKPTVSSASGVDTDGNPYVEVTVTYQFQSITSYVPGFKNVSLSRTVRMRSTTVVPPS